jgi:hypothetical protein
MQANKLQFRSPGFEALSGHRRSGDDLLAPDTRRLRPAETRNILILIASGFINN